MVRVLIGMLLLASFWASAEAVYQLQVKTDRADARYELGATAGFVAAATIDGVPATTGEVQFELTNDGRDRLGVRNLAPDAAGQARQDYRSAEPGFVLCTVKWVVDGAEKATAQTAAAFAPEQIRQGQPEPEDFDAFWAEGKRQAALIDWDVKLEPAPELSTATLEMFRISFANLDHTRLYGFLSIPKNGDGPFPAVVVIPGASPANNAPGGHMLEGVISLFLNVHSYEPAPLGTPTEGTDTAAYGGEVYYAHLGAADRNANFFRRAWLGMDRATEWLRQHPQFDGKNLGVCGWSQGGGSTLALAGLNPAFTFAVANQPALSDHGAYRQGRTPGWPFFVDAFHSDLGVMNEVAYIDVANLAKRIQCPTIVLVGFIDGACRPGSVYAAYNNIAAPGKQIVDQPETNHTWNEPYNAARQTMLDALMGDLR